MSLSLMNSTTKQKKPQSYEIDLNQFVIWQAEDAQNREVRIDIDRKCDYSGSDISIYVYQYFDEHEFALQRVWSVDEIDLETRYRKQLEEKYRALKEKLGVD